jgi:nitrate reductase NapE component
MKTLYSIHCEEQSQAARQRFQDWQNYKNAETLLDDYNRAEADYQKAKRQVDRSESIQMVLIYAVLAGFIFAFGFVVWTIIAAVSK